MLNPQQAAAVASGHRQVVVTAGAGTGKTTTFAARVQALMARGHSASTIAAITFTRKAAAELEERITATGCEVPWCGTIHSLCAKLLRGHASAIGRTPNFSVWDAEESDALRGELRASLKSLYRKAPELEAEVERVYQDALSDSDALDFDGLERGMVRALRKATQQGRPKRFRIVLIDESQDLNANQWEIVRALADEVFCVGDLRQSIYQFRGARPDILLAMLSDQGAESHALIQGHRCGPSVTAIANAVVPESLRSRLPDMLPRAGDYDVVERSDTISVRREDAEQTMVLARTWRELESVEADLRAAGVPVQVEGGSVWDRPAGKAIAAMVRLVANPVDTELAIRIARLCGLTPMQSLTLRQSTRTQHVPGCVVVCGAVPGFDAWQKSLSVEHGWLLLNIACSGGKNRMLTERASIVIPETPIALGSDAGDWTAARQELVEAGIAVEQFRAWWSDRMMRETLTPNVTPGVLLSTIHSAKGLERDHVFLLAPNPRLFDATSDEDERWRLLYVAITRARKRLTFVIPEGERAPRAAHRFLQALDGVA